MRVLLVKTSSLGDLLHTLPALTDASAAISGIRFDWVVEEAFAEIPEWHPAVDRVIKIAIRRWRKAPLKAIFSGEWATFKKQLRAEEYDLILDAQGLIKSALLSRTSGGKVIGLDADSAREPLASCFYNQRLGVEKGEHAVVRLRKLFALALGYRFPGGEPDSRVRTQPSVSTDSTILFVHGTTWETKHWPEECWQRLAEIVNGAGYKILFPWWSEKERERAERIAMGHDAEILPKSSLSELSELLQQQARAAVCVDSGLAHLVAALGIPAVTIYGATSSRLTGTTGKHQLHAEVAFECAPCLKRECTYQGESMVRPACYQTVSPEAVWQKLLGEIGQDG